MLRERPTTTTVAGPELEPEEALAGSDQAYIQAMQAALAHVGRDEHAQAVPFLLEAVRLDPQAPLPHKALCAVLLTLGRRAEAQAQCREWKRLETDPEAVEDAEEVLTDLEDEASP